MKSIATAAVGALLTFASGVYAQPPLSPICTSTSSNICFNLNLPTNTYSTGKGDVYFQIKAPTSYAWVALGQGDAMAGANIFVIYTSGDGQNVTLSPRLGTGHTMPQYNSNAQVTLLEGSGVSNGVMQANVKCSNCDSWNGGSMDFTQKTGSWIWAAGSGSPLNTDDKSATIAQHSFSNSAAFSWDMSKGQGGDDVNPFVQAAAAAPTASNSAAVTGSPTATTATSASTTITTGTLLCTPNANATYQGGPPFGPPKKRDACPEGTSPVTSGTSPAIINNSFDPATFDRVALIHGVLAGIAFVAIFPLGGILVRLCNFTGLVWVHAAMQVLGWVIYIVAFGLGVYLVRTLQPDNHAHPTIGGIIFIVLISQPITGFLHHRGYLRFGGRTRVTTVHLVIGRIIVILGIANGGLGLHLAGEEGSARIAYGVIGVLMTIAYIASIVIGERRRKRAAMNAATNPRMQLDRHSPTSDDVPLEHIQTQAPKYN